MSMLPQRSTVSLAIRATSSPSDTSTTRPTPSSNPPAASPAPLALGERLVAPQVHDRAHVADLDRERPEKVAEVLLLDRGPLLGVQPDDLRELSRVDVVGPL